MIIRLSTDNEGATIHALHLEAFGQPEGPIVADLACAMLGDISAEPRLSLVAEEDGLADIRQLIDQAPEYLAEGGWLLLEHGWQQAQAVRELLLARGFHAVMTRQDLGGQDRVSGGQWFGDVAR